MKKSYILAFASLALLLASCDDMLDKSPRSTFENNPAFWNNQNQVESYCNTFYSNYVGYNRSSNYGWFYFKSLNDDQTNSNFENWTFTTIPGNSSYWNDAYTEVRRVNYMLTGLRTSTLPNKATYIAIGRLNRAWQYYQLVRMYGDSEWQNKPVLDPDPKGADQAQIYASRTDRDIVMDSVLNDLDYAIANLGTSSDKTAWSRDMARAMKAEICLFEGTFSKYRTEKENGKAPDAARAARYLQQAQAACEDLMNSGNYTLSANYGDIYNSTELGANKEIIFFRNYEKDVLSHGLCDFTSGSTVQRGLSRDAFDAFLFLDGKPKATTTYNTVDTVKQSVQVIGGNVKKILSIREPLQVRDKRLSALIDSVVCLKGWGWSRLNKAGQLTGQAEMTSSSGYTIRKYDNTEFELYYRANTTTGYTDAPLYWYAEVLLAYAEAKAELADLGQGAITQNDLDISVNLLQTRAGLPAMNINPQADPANNMGVSNLLWEIRRTRRCELALDNWIRYWDLIRWHQLDKLDSQKYPNINRGAHIANAAAKGIDNVDAEGYIIPASRTRTFDPKYYLFPVPSNETTLNTNVGQNLGW